MYLQLYDFDHNNASVQLNLGTCQEYDIPESGTVTDSHGRRWTIATNTLYGQYKVTTFTLPGSSKLANFVDFTNTLRELVPTADTNAGSDIYSIYQSIGNGRLTPDEETGSTPDKPYLQFDANYLWWYPESGAPTNNNNYHGWPSPSETTLMVYGDAVSGDNNGGYVYGWCSVYTYSGGSGYSVIELGRALQFNANTLNPPEREPGEEGFRPIGDHPVDKVIGGGTISGHTPKYQTDNISQPGAPDESSASAARLGFIRVYKISEANLNYLGRLLFNPLFKITLNNPMNNPLDAIISLNIFPCAPDVGGSEVIGAFGYNMASQILDITAHGNPISNQFKTFDFGTVAVPEDWNSYLDYDATSVTLFLPFIGEVELPADEVIASSVNVQYTIDFFTGMCVANVLIQKSVILSSRRTVSHKTQHSYQGNCAINLPLSAVNYGSMIGSFVNAASSGLRTGMAGAVGSFASDLVSGNFKPTITTKGTLSANAGYCGILYPYIIVTRPITTEPDKYQEVLGYPSYMENSIGACKGLCVCEDIKLNGITGATDSELSEIKRLCREGVYN